MEEVISGPTIISETDVIGVERIDPDIAPVKVSVSEGQTFLVPPTTSGSALMAIHPDEAGPHPGVLNEDVLENVFKHIINRSSSTDKTDILKDVRNIRLVCKTWKHAVTLLYRRAQAPTEFRGLPAVQAQLKTFLEVMKNSDLIPVQHYGFQINCIRDDDDIELFKDFLVTCGSDTVSLCLTIMPYYVQQFDVTELADLKLDKLKKLELHLYVVGISNNQTPDRVSLLGLLLNSTKALEEVKFNFLYSASDDAPIMKLLARIICQGLPRTVKILHLSNILLDEENFGSLTETGLKLEEFRLDSSCFSGNELAIREFLENQANTLKTLLIMWWRIDQSTEFEFPRLNELLCLEMNGIHVKPFSLTKTFPKLQKLDLEGEESFLAGLLSYERIVPSVKDFNMPVSWKSNPQLTKMISDQFPNITTLQISPTFVDKEAARKILQEFFIHFPNIEQLYISMYLQDVWLNADSIFSGVSKAGCKRIRREANFANVNLMNEQSMPSILNLTKLKKLVVTQRNSCARFILTDMAAHFVFLQMASLKKLSLSSAKMSPRYVELLEKKLTLAIKQNSFKDGENSESEVSEDSEGDSD